MQYNRITSDTKLAEILKNLDKRISGVETVGTGSISWVDENGVETIIGELPDGTVGFAPFVGDTTPPPVPSIPVVSIAPGVINVSWDGVFVDGADKPVDFQYVNVLGYKIVDGVAGPVVNLGLIRSAQEFIGIGPDVAAVGETWEFALSSVDYNRNTSEVGAHTAPVTQTSYSADVIITEALSSLSDGVSGAQASADGKSTNYYEPTAPTNVPVGKLQKGDTWYDTSNGYRVNTWNGSAWVITQDSATAIQKADSKGITYTQDTVPPVSARLPQNLWIDTSLGLDKVVHKYWNGSAWTPVSEKAASDAKTVADAKGETIYSDTEPAAAKRLSQNLWVDTTGGINIHKRWNGSAWVVVVDSRIPSTAAAVTAVDARVDSVSASINVVSQDLQDAQEVMSTQGITLTQSTVPSAEFQHSSNLWIDISLGADKAVHKYWNGTTWSAVSEKAAKDAQTTADSKGETIYSSTAPAASKQLPQNTWIDTTGGINIAKRWDGSGWVVAADSRIASTAAAVTAVDSRVDTVAGDVEAVDTKAQNALDSAASKGVVLTQSVVPAAQYQQPQNLWNDTSLGANNTVTKYWNTTTSQWTALADKAATDAATLAGSKSAVIYSNTAPTGADANALTLWIDTTNGANTPKKWVSGTTWTAVTDKVATDAATAAATAQKATSYTINPSFDDWSGTLPDNYTVWSSTPYTKNTTTKRVGQQSLQMSAAANGDNRGIAFGSAIIGHAPNLEYFTVEVEFMLTSGTSLQGAGVLLDWGGLTPQRTAWKFADSVVGTPVLNKWYRVSKVMRRNTTATGTWTGMSGYLMANYSENGTMTAKTMLFDWFNVRPSTAEEILSYNAPTQSMVDKIWESARSYINRGTSTDNILVIGGPAPTVVDSATAMGGKALQKSGTGNGWWVDLNAKQAFDPLALYKVTARIRVTTPNNVSGAGRFYLGMNGWAADGTTYVNSTGANSNSSQHYMLNTTSFAQDGTWVDFVGYVRGNSTGNSGGSGTSSNPTTMHANVRYIAPLVIMDFSGGNAVMELSHLSMDIVGPEGYQAIIDAANAVTTAAADATAKANQAKTDAISAAASDATSKATAAQNAAIAAAAADATAKAEQAEADAAATAAADATAKANQAKADAIAAADAAAQLKADGAEQAAIDAAAADAQAKADAAEAAAIAAAALDATAKAEQAEANAAATAAADATAKADAAEDAAIAAAAIAAQAKADQAKADAIAAASADASSKAAAAEQAAIDAAAADATAKAEAAEAAAAATAAADATAKADAAEAAAIAAADAAAQLKADGAEQAAIDAAAADAQAKADAAEAAAIAAAALDATAKAEQAEADATAAAALDATSKANQAKTDAITAADSAAQLKADAAAARAINAQAYSNNASFDDWTATLPTGFGTWSTGPVKETSIVRRAPFAVRFNVPDATAQHGMQFTSILSHAPNLEYFTVELDFYLVSGTLGGAGMILDWNGLTNNRAQINLATEFPSPITGKWYTLTKVLRRPTNSTGTWSSMGGYLMGQWSGHGTGAAKNIIYDWFNIRPSTAEEILSYNAPTKSYVDQAEADAISSAAATAQTKADAAKNAAIAAAAADATAKAEQAEADAAATAAADATAKANQAKADAIAAADAAAQLKADNAEQAAIDAAAADAQAKADAAEAAAIAAAALDATAKAEQAEADAAATAALDATAKANQAKQDAITAAANDATNKVATAKAEAIAIAAAGDKVPGKWLFSFLDNASADSKAPAPSVFVDPGTVRSYVADGGSLVNNYSDTYRGSLRTMVKVISSKTVAFTATHDDAGSVYVDGVRVYNADVYSQNKAISFSLSAGWHVIELTWSENAGGDGWMGFSPIFGTLVDELAAPSLAAAAVWDAQQVSINAALDATTKADAAQLNAIQSQAYTKNPSFEDWTSVLPAGYGSFNTNPTKETTIVRSGKNSMRFNCTDSTTQRGVTVHGNITHAPNLDYYTIEVDVYLNSGSTFGGSGVLLDWGGMTNQRVTLSLATEIPTPLTGKWYRVVKTFKKPSNATGTWTAMNAWVMGQYSSGLGTQSVKDVIFDWINIRPSTVEEVNVFTLQNTTVPTLISDLDTAEGKISSAEGAINTLNNTTIPGLQGSINTLNNTTIPALDGRLDSAETAISTTLPGAIQGAQDAADMALLIAPVSTNAPVLADGTGRPSNSVWTRIDASGNEIGYWRWTGSAWVTMELTPTVIPNLSAAKITSGTVDTNRLNANEIAAAVATVIQLNASRITSGTIDTARLNATEIAAAVATVIQLNADRIVAGTINTARLNANEIAAAVATIIELNADRITAGTISTARLNALEIAAAVATVIELNADRITSGTIAADRLDANLIRAKLLDAALINADELLVSGSIKASMLDVSIGGNNLVYNSSFEVDSNSDGLADGWAVWTRGAGDAGRVFTNTRVSGHFPGSTYAQKVTSTTVTNTEQSSIQATQLFSIGASQKAVLSLYGRASVAGTFSISLRCEDDAGAYKGDANFTAAFTTTAQRFSGVVTTPAGTTRAKVTITTPGSLSNGHWFEVDGVKAELGDILSSWSPASTELLPGTIVANLIEANALNGKTITGSTIQTEATASRGIKLTTTELAGYNASGVKNFSLTSTGSLTLAGAVQTSSTITGSTVTGSTVQTEVTASRGIKLTTTELAGYDAAGVKNFSLTTAGVLTIKGDITSGSTMTGATVTGSTIQTEATASRGIKLTTTELAGYDASGNKNFSLSTGGTLAIKGTINAGSTISGATLTGAGIETTSTAARGVKIASTGITTYDGSGNMTFKVDASTGVVEAPGLKANSITGTMIAADAVQARHLAIGDFTNLYTSPQHLAETGGVALSNATLYTGAEVIPVGLAMSIGARDHTSAEKVAVRPGDQFYIELTAKKLAGNAALNAGIWVTTTAGGAGTGWSQWSGLNGSFTQIADLGNGWARYKATPYVNAAWTDVSWAQLYLQLSQFSPYDTTWLIADVVWRRRNGGELIVDGAIDGKVITGATVQTTATASRGIKLTSAELAGYDGSGNKNFSLDSTGALTLKGAIQSGSTITGATLTGAGIETTATASRGVKIASTGITTYDASGNMTFKVDAATGLVEAPGLKANSISSTMISATAIDGKTVTGATIQTEVTAQRGIKLTSTEFAGYDTAGVKNFSLLSDGTLSLKGAITSGSTITGAIVTGGTVQSEATASRGIKMTSTELAGYDTAGVKNFSLTSAGALTLIGQIKSGSTIEGATLTGTDGLQTSTVANTGVKIANTGIKAYDAANNLTFSVDAATGVVKAPGLEANTITSDMIDTGAVETDHMTAGTIDGGVLVAGSVTALELAAKAVTADKMVITSTDNIMPEADFSAGLVQWGGVSGAWSVDLTGSRGGTTALKVVNDATEQTRYNTKVVPIEAGTAYRISCHVKASATITTGKIGLKVRTTDAAGVQTITKVTSNSASASAANTWYLIGALYNMPAGAVKAEFGLYTDATFSTGTAWFDNFMVTRAADGNLVVDGSIDGKTITGALIQTQSAASRGLKLTQTALNAYDSSGAITFSLSGVTGKALLTGRILSGVSGEAGLGIIPATDSYNGTQCGIFVTSDGSFPGGVGGMWVNNGYTAQPERLQLRGHNDGDVEIAGQNLHIRRGGGRVGNFSNWALGDAANGSNYLPNLMIAQSGTAYLRLANAPTSSSAANAIIAVSPEGVMYRSTSSLRYKADVQDWDAAERALQLRPRSWVDRNPIDKADPFQRYYGYIAEEVAEIMPEFVTYNEFGEPESVTYDRMPSPATIAILKVARNRVKTLQDKVTELEARMTAAGI